MSQMNGNLKTTVWVKFYNFKALCTVSSEWWTCRVSSQVYLTSSNFKTIFWQLEEIGFPGDLNNEHAEPFPSVIDNIHFQTNFQVKLLTQCALYAERLEQRIWSLCSVTNKQQFQDQLWTEPLMTHRLLCPRRPEQYVSNFFPSMD